MNFDAFARVNPRIKGKCKTSLICSFKFSSVSPYDIRKTAEPDSTHASAFQNALAATYHLPTN